MFRDSHSFRPAVERLFFAILPPRQLALGMAAWSERELGQGWQVQHTDRLHVTLAITEDFRRLPVHLPDRLLRVGEMVAAQPVTVTLDRLTVSNRSAALRSSRANADLKALHQSIGQAMTLMQVPMRENWTFSPHMTLGYRDGRPAHRPVEARQWQAEEFVLIRSLVGRTRHLTLGRWPLRAAPAAQYELF
ncbi:MAG: 2'-5' RNA ligase family protein [Sphingobium sp.]